mmetsp:Transcript_44105/g.77422  ORF Transcript_44105/g.77422 Transcript_44105/m.77422 type:complete len:335 (-) Transcript_44105:39-1043(-)
MRPGERAGPWRLPSRPIGRAGGATVAGRGEAASLGVAGGTDDDSSVAVAGICRLVGGPANAGSAIHAGSCVARCGLSFIHAGLCGVSAAMLVTVGTLMIRGGCANCASPLAGVCANCASPLACGAGARRTGEVGAVGAARAGETDAVDAAGATRDDGRADDSGAGGPGRAGSGAGGTWLTCPIAGGEAARVATESCGLLVGATPALAKLVRELPCCACTSWEVPGETRTGGAGLAESTEAGLAESDTGSGCVTDTDEPPPDSTPGEFGSTATACVVGVGAGMVAGTDALTFVEAGRAPCNSGSDRAFLNIFCSVPASLGGPLAVGLLLRPGKSS